MEPIFIAHRGNLYGPNKIEENKPETIINAIESGFDCEIDVWFIDKLYLGHDYPMYKINIEFLEKYKDKLWIHCKNLDALIYLKNLNFNCFFHDRDFYTITTKGHIWGNINSKMAKEVVCVMPELSYTFADGDGTFSFDVFAICTDFPIHFKRLASNK